MVDHSQAVGEGLGVGEFVGDEDGGDSSRTGDARSLSRSRTGPNRSSRGLPPRRRRLGSGPAGRRGHDHLPPARPATHIRRGVRRNGPRPAILRIRWKRCHRHLGRGRSWQAGAGSSVIKIASDQAGQRPSKSPSFIPATNSRHSSRPSVTYMPSASPVLRTRTNSPRVPISTHSPPSHRLAARHAGPSPDLLPITSPYSHQAARSLFETSMGFPQLSSIMLRLCN